MTSSGFPAPYRVWGGARCHQRHPRIIVCMWHVGNFEFGSHGTMYFKPKSDIYGELGRLVEVGAALPEGLFLLEDVDFTHIHQWRGAGGGRTIVYFILLMCFATNPLHSIPVYHAHALQLYQWLLFTHFGRSLASAPPDKNTCCFFTTAITKKMCVSQINKKVYHM